MKSRLIDCAESVVFWVMDFFVCFFETWAWWFGFLAESIRLNYRRGCELANDRFISTHLLRKDKK